MGKGKENGDNQSGSSAAAAANVGVCAVVPPMQQMGGPKKAPVDCVLCCAVCYVRAIRSSLVWSLIAGPMS